MQNNFKSGYVHELMLNNDDTLFQIFADALFASYSHSCQIFSAEKSYNRDKTSNSFLETVNGVLKDKSLRHITIIYRDIVNEHYDLLHWEFGMCSKELYLNICVRPDLAEIIFKNHNLKTIKK